MDPGLKILTSAESKQCDTLTRQKEGMNAHDLMDRATARIFNCLLGIIPEHQPITVLCGPGDNGADGLCIASMLAAKGYSVNTKICLLGKNPSAALAFRIKLYGEQKNMQPVFVQSPDELDFDDHSTVVDALFGTGLTRPLENHWLLLIEKINKKSSYVISIDIPSGLMDETGNLSMIWVKATKVISIQSPKPSLLYPENKIDFEVIDCGIQTTSINTHRYFLDYGDTTVQKQMNSLLPHRPRHSHKGIFGHTLLIGGNTGMHGAISMAAKSCYDAGSGLTTVLSPANTLPYLAHIPGIMHIADNLNESSIRQLPEGKFRSVAIGPGLGNNAETHALLWAVLDKFRFPLVIDADALNIVAADPELFKMLPKGSLLTPHPAEFNRLFGSTTHGKEKEELALGKAAEFGIYILAKNTYSFLACPDGKVFYNGTGNAQLSRGGSGDKLTGMISGLYAQNQNMHNAALAGMYFSGIGVSLI